MATLQKIRSKGPLLVIVIGLALFAFIAGDAWKVFQPHRNKQNAGIVDGKKISALDFQNMVEEFTKVQELLYGRQISDENLTKTRDMIWQSYVSYRLIEKEAGKIGLTVTDEEIQNMIKEGTNPLLNQTPFVNPQTGTFDKAIMEMFASQGNPDQVSLIMSYTEKNLKQALLISKYQELIMKSLISNPVSAQNSFDGRINESEILLAALPYSSVADSAVTITDSEIKDLYGRNKEQYRNLVETRDIQYIDYVVNPSGTDRKATQDEVTESCIELDQATDDYAAIVRSSGSSLQYVDIPMTKNAFPNDIASRLDSISAGEVYGPFYSQADDSYNAFKLLSRQTVPDSIQFRQIQVVAATPDATGKLADSIATALKNGADFAEMAKKYSQNGEAQWISSNMYEGRQIDMNSTKIINALNTTGVKEVANIDMGQGNIVIQVVDRKAMTDKYKVAVVKRPVEFSKETYNAAYNKISQFLAANSDYDKLTRNAEDNGFRLLTREGFRSDEHLVGGVPGTHDALKWVFDAKPRSVSPLYDCGNGSHLMIVALSSINPKGYAPVEKVRDRLKAEIMRDKKAEILTRQFEAARTFDEAKAIPGVVTDSIRHITFSVPAFVSVTRGNEPVVGAMASKTGTGQLSKPFKGNSGVYVLQPYGKTKQDGKFDDKTEEAALSNMSLRMAGGFMNDLYLKADVTDLRYLFF